MTSRKRLAGFDAAELARALVERDAVRVRLMRATVHLVTADDWVTLRPWVQPVLDRAFAGQAFARQLAGVDIGDVISTAAALLADEPMTGAELRRALATRWPGRDPAALGYAVTYLFPVVQVPPRGIWGSRGPARWAAAESWLGRGLDERPDPARLFARYLAAFGPATVQDVQTWSGLTQLAEVADGLGPVLRRFRGEDGRELLDLPDAPRPGADTPAPPRFLPEYDNVLLSHADRSRIVPGNRPIPLPPGNGGAKGTLLVDGMFHGTWEIRRTGPRATLVIETFAPLTGADVGAVTDEGMRLLAFAAPESGPDVVLTDGAARGR
jgi:hypothetical protein